MKPFAVRYSVVPWLSANTLMLVIGQVLALKDPPEVEKILARLKVSIFVASSVTWFLTMLKNPLLGAVFVITWSAAQTVTGIL